VYVDCLLLALIKGEKADIFCSRRFNYYSVGVALWNFYKQAKSPTFAIPSANAWVSAGMLPLFFYSAYLGGSLIYEYGVGVQRQGEGPEIAKKQKAQ
jgi:hypothetical protein